MGGERFDGLSETTFADMAGSEMTGSGTARQDVAEQDMADRDMVDRDMAELDHGALAAAAEALPEATYLTLARIVENQIIPRLLLKHDNPWEAHPAPIEDAAIVAFTKIVMHDSLEEAYAHIATLMAGGSTLEAVFLDLLAPTAVRLGELWETDEVSFSDVTLALCKLHRMVREFSRQEGEQVEQVLGHRVLLAAVPGNQHLLGVAMVEELFRHSGWNVYALPSSSVEEIIDTAREEWFAVVGLSASCDGCEAHVEPLIAKIRAASLNPAVVVLVGGRYFIDNPEQALRMGADATAIDARAAIIASKRYVDASKRGVWGVKP